MSAQCATAWNKIILHGKTREDEPPPINLGIIHHYLVVAESIKPDCQSMSAEIQLNCKEAGRSSSFRSLRRLPIRSGSGFSAFSLLSRGSGDTNANSKDTPSRRFVPRRKSKDTASSSVNVERVQRRAERKKLLQALDKLHSETDRELSQDEIIKLMSKELARSSLSKQTASTADDSGEGEDAYSTGVSPSYMERWLPRISSPGTVTNQSAKSGSVGVSTLGLTSSADIDGYDDDDDAAADDDDVNVETDHKAPFKPPEYIEFVTPVLIEL